MRHQSQSDYRLFDLAQFKYEGVGNVTLLHLGLADVKLSSLTVVIGETLGTLANFAALFLRGKRSKPGLARFPRTALSTAPGVRLIVDAACGVDHRHMPVLLEIMKGTFRRVDGNMRKVGSPKPLHLRVQIGEITALQQWIVAEVNTLNDVVGAECDLLGFREEVIDAAIEDQASDAADGHLILGDQLRRIQNI